MKQILSIIFFILLLGNFSAQAQIVSGETPPSFIQSIKAPNILAEEVLSSTQIITAPNIDSLQKEDAITDEYKDIPFRFGTLTKVEYSLKNAGKWLHYADGTSKYQLLISAKDAVSINLNFSQFHLSRNAMLFVFNQKRNDVLGAITAENNKKDSLFSIRPMKGDSLILELYVPTNEIENNTMTIGGVVYGYRSLFEKSNKAFGSSGNCEIDINCPEGDKWQDIKRSVVMILFSNNTRKCSGTLINNTALDSIPYILSAEHCGIGSNSVFIFNYESPLCHPNTNGVLSQSVSGATYKASSGFSDFALYEMSSKPPASYEAYYAGWSALNTPAMNGTCIHHPNGDVKKISSSNDSIFESSYNDVVGHPTTHWRVKYWSNGSTESGSSGSPLFDENQRVIGQLHGGFADCGIKLPDYYGKFSTSWNKKTQFNRQLAHWLDPLNTNQKVLDGLDTKASIYANDIKLLGIHGLDQYYCNAPKSFVYNFNTKGVDTVFNVQFKIEINNSVIKTINWNGILLPNEVQKIEVNSFTLNNGKNHIKIYVDSINGGLDANTINDTAQFDLYYNGQPKMATLTLKTDNFGSETSWKILSSDGYTIEQGANYKNISGGKTYTIPLCLYDSCFTFNLYDSQGDGFTSDFYGKGYAKITVGTEVLLNEANFTSAKKSSTFCLDTTTGIWENKMRHNAVQLFPNPVQKDGSITIETNNSKEINVVEIYNIEGRKLENIPLKNEEVVFQLKNKYSAGVYILLFKNKKDEMISRKRLVVLR